MSESLLETARAAHERIERLEATIIGDLLERPKTHALKIEQDHRTKQRVDSMIEAARYLERYYTDVDGSRKEEIAALGGGTGEQVFERFHERLRQVRETYRRFPNLNEEVSEWMDLDPHVDVVDVKFSGAEGDGRFVDMYELHQQFVNLKHADQKLDYITFLDRFPHEDFGSSKLRATAAFRRWQHAVLDYLTGLMRRINPLEDLDGLLASATRRATAAYQTLASSASSATAMEADGATLPSVAAAGAAGPRSDQAAAAAAAASAGSPASNPLFCTYCIKTFAKDTVFRSHLSGAAHAKAVRRAQVSSGTGSSEQHAVPSSSSSAAAAAAATGNDVTAAAPEPATTSPSSTAPCPRDPVLERMVLAAQISVLADYLSLQIGNTKSQAQKRQAMTLTELEQNRDTAGVDYEDLVDDDDEEDEEEKIWNPKGLPLDVTGRPIPYWLYRLHGLGVEYVCEICGDYTYMGHYAFEKHFQEPRHQGSLRRLGIPSHKAFHYVTRIAHALDLQKKLDGSKAAVEWRPDDEEEFETSDGTVINKRIHSDMLRQGLLT